MTVKLESNIVRNLNQNDISSYLKEINKFPLLSHEEEYNLADEWIKNKFKISQDRVKELIKINSN